ncbi:MAG: polysaccharide pyruvyl transferase family protein, partial [Acidimicrobiia bacterium]
VYHQVQQDAGPEGWRWESKELNAGMIANKIPHRFYRKYRRFQIYQVPKVSWVITPTVGHRAGEVWDQLLLQHYTDWEAIFLDDGAHLPGLAEQNAADPRFVLIPAAADSDSQVREALRRARGEYLALLHGWAALEPRLLARALRRLEPRPRTSLLTVGYQVPARDGSHHFRRAADTRLLDQRWGQLGLPVFALARRREWSKALSAGQSVGEAWKLVRHLAQADHLPDPLVGLPAPDPAGPLPHHLPPLQSERGRLMADLQQAGSIPRTVPVVARFALRKALGRRDATPSDLPLGEGQPRPGESRPRIRYIGWVGHENLGDEALLEAVRRLMPWAEIDPKGESGELLLLGGGTLINRSRYLSRLREQDSPRIERAVFGTGVANPEYWGKLREDPAGWADFLSTCCYVGVRGPISASLLRSWGYRGPLEVVGDPALALSPPQQVERHPDRVAVNLVRTDGERWGGDDRAVQATFAQLVKQLVAEGREVWMFSCFPGDDHPGLEIMRAAGVPDLPYLAGYRSLEESLRFLASCRLLVGERLHALVLAAACGTPFVGVEYRPKVRDFARSVGQEHLVVRSDQASGEALRALVARLEDDYQETAQGLADQVTGYRASLRTASATIREALGT